MICQQRTGMCRVNRGVSPTPMWLHSRMRLRAITTVPSNGGSFATYRIKQLSVGFGGYLVQRCYEGVSPIKLWVLDSAKWVVIGERQVWLVPCYVRLSMRATTLRNVRQRQRGG